MTTEASQIEQGRTSEVIVKIDPEAQGGTGIVEYTPVPDDDIAKCAKGKCPTCLGRGKVNIRKPGSETVHTIVCQCALKRFVVANNHRLSVGKGRRLYYRNVPEGNVQETEVEEAAAPCVADSQNEGDDSRLAGMRRRILELDGTISEIAARYAQKREPLEAREREAAAKLGREEEVSQKLTSDHKVMTDNLAVLDLRITLLESQLTDARGAKVAFEGQLAANLEAQSHEDERLAPFWKEVAAARDALADHNKRAHAAATPYRQRKESLIKRLSHKAASLGLPVWEEQSGAVEGVARG